MTDDAFPDTIPTSAGPISLRRCAAVRDARRNTRGRLWAWLGLVVLGACGGTDGTQTSDAKVPNDDVEDGADSVTEDAHDSGDTATPWPFSPPDNAKGVVFDSAETFLPGDGSECGMDVSDETGGIRACFSQIGPDRVSTLCDEGQRRCVAPTTRCTKGWCYVPPSMFLSGFVDLPGEHRGFIPTAMRSIPRGLWVQQTETTLGQFRAIMGYEPDFTTGCGDNCPVAGISIFEAMELANRMSVAEGRQPCYVLEKCGDVMLVPRGSSPDRPAKSWECERGTFPDFDCKGYRLPSWEEWELLARGGSPFCFPIGPWIGGYDYDFLDPDVPIAKDYSIYGGTAYADYEPYSIPPAGEGTPAYGPIGPQPVRSTLPNAFGLYEVHGNVNEYTFSEAPWKREWGGTPPPEWNRTGRAPFSVTDTGGFMTEVTSEIGLSLPLGGGMYFGDAALSCAHIAHRFVFEAVAVLNQGPGMRLVRTTPLRFDEQ